MAIPPIQPDEIARIVMLIRGLMEGGGKYWCYVSVKPSRHEDFKKALNGGYNIQHFVDDGYGEVIVSGQGDTPPGEVTKQVADLFNVPPQNFFKDKNPEATLAKKLAEIQQASGDA